MAANTKTKQGASPINCFVVDGSIGGRLFQKDKSQGQRREVEISQSTPRQFFRHSLAPAVGKLCRILLTSSQFEPRILMKRKE
jgi:hypothetical protein